MVHQPIRVFDAKTGRRMSNCSRSVADKAVRRGNAEWREPDAIALLVTQEDRDRMKQEVIEEAQSICAACGELCTPENVTVDHDIPRSRNGPDAKDNYRCMHETCNQDKGDLTLAEYRELRRQLLSGERGACLQRRKAS